MCRQDSTAFAGECYRAGSASACPESWMSGGAQFFVVAGAGPMPMVPFTAPGREGAEGWPPAFQAPMQTIPGAFAMPAAPAAASVPLPAVAGRCSPAWAQHAPAAERTGPMQALAAPYMDLLMAEYEEMPRLTKGARRRMQQRLRKKLGRLERQLSEEAELGRPSEQQPVMLQAPMSTPEVEILCNDEFQDVPILTIDEGSRQTALGQHVGGLLAPAVAATALEKVVPVCAIQQDVELQERAELDVTDAFVSLPCQGKGRPPAGPEESRQAAELGGKRGAEQAEVQAPGCRTVDLGRGTGARTPPEGAVRSAASWPLQPGERLPVANTFVHFREAHEHERPRRRSLSV